MVRRGAYDNPKVAVLKILPTLERVENPRFAALRAFYNLDVRYCTPGKEGAHEKGIIERKVETFRKSRLVPVPEIADWDDLNRLLLDACDRHARAATRSRRNTRSRRSSRRRGFILQPFRRARSPAAT